MVRFCDPSCDRKAETRTGALGWLAPRSRAIGPIEPLEECAPVIRWDAGAVVRDGDTDVALDLLSSMFTTPSGAHAATVLNQVQQHPPQTGLRRH